MFWTEKNTVPNPADKPFQTYLNHKDFERSEQGTDKPFKTYLNITDLNNWCQVFSNLPQLQRSEQGSDKPSQIYPNFKDLNRGLTSLLKPTSTSKIWTKAVKMPFQTYLNIKDLNNGCHVFSNLPPPPLQISEQGSDKPS